MKSPTVFKTQLY